MQTLPHSTRQAWATTFVILGVVFLLLCKDSMDLVPWLDEAITLQQMHGTWSTFAAMPKGTGMTTVGALAAPPTPLAPFSSIAPTIYHLDVHPPLYYQVAWAWSFLFGPSVGALRALSLLCTGLAAGTILLAARTIAPTPHQRAGMLLAVALLLSASSGLVFAAGNIRNYAMALMWVGGAFCALARLWTPTPRPQIWFVAAGACAGLAFFTHYFTILVLGPAMLATALRFWRQPLHIAWGLAAMAGPVVLALPYALHHLGARPGQHESPSTWWQEIVLAAAAPASALLHPISNSPLAAILTAAGVGGLLWLSWRLARAHPPLIPACIGLGAYMPLMWLLFAMTDKSLTTVAFVPRYNLFVLPPLVLCAGAVLAHALEKAHIQRAHLAPAGLVAGALIVGLHLPANTAKTPPWTYDAAVRAQAAAMADDLDNALIILPTWTPTEGPPVLPYFSPQTPVLLVDDATQFDTALTIALERTHVAILGLYPWTSPRGTHAQATRALLATGAFTPLQRGTWMLRRAQ